MTEVATAVATPPAQAAAPAASPGFLAGQTAETPAQSAPASLFGESIYKDGKFVDGWTEQFQDKYPSAAGKLSQIKDQEGFMKTVDWAVRTASGRELKGMPNDTWSEPEKADFRKAFDVPDDAAQYKFKPENLPAGVHWPDEANEVLTFLHQNHAPKAMVEGLGQKFAEHLKAQTDNALETFESKIRGLEADSKKHFDKEWGAEAEGKRQALSNYVKSQFSEQELSDPIIRAALSHQKIVGMVEKAHSSIREGTIPGTGREMSAGSKSYRQQARELTQTQEYRAGDKATVQRAHELYALDAQEKRAANGRR